MLRPGLVFGASPRRDKLSKVGGWDLCRDGMSAGIYDYLRKSGVDFWGGGGYGRRFMIVKDVCCMWNTKRRNLRVLTTDSDYLV